MKWKKSIASLALAGCLLASSVPAVAFAANETVAVDVAKEQKAVTDQGVHILNEEKSIYLTNDLVNGKHDQDSVTIRVLGVDLADDSTIKATLSNDDVAVFDTEYKKDGVDRYTYTSENDVPTAESSKLDNGIGERDFVIKSQKGAGVKGSVTVTISGRRTDGKTFEEKYTITVGEPKYLVNITAADQVVEYDQNEDVYVDKDLTYNPTDTTQKPDITYESSDTNVVAVENGEDLLVTGRGTAVITGTYQWFAKSTDEKRTEGTFTFTVNVVDSKGTLLVVESEDARDTYPDWTRLGTEKDVYIGNSISLTAQYSQDRENFVAANDVTWSSSNTNVATVTNGVVKATAVGSTVITASTSDGLKAYFTVNVKGEGIAATGVAFDKPTVTMTQGQKNEDISVVTIPEGADVSNLTIIKDGDTWLDADGKEIWTLEGELANGDDPKENKEEYDTEEFNLSDTRQKVSDPNMQRIRVNNRDVEFTYDDNLKAFTASDQNVNGNITLVTIMKDNKITGLSVTVAEDAKLGNYDIDVPVEYYNPHQQIKTYGRAKCTLTVTSPNPDAVTTFSLQDYVDTDGDYDDETYKWDFVDATEKTLSTNTVIPVINQEINKNLGASEAPTAGEDAGLGIVDRMNIQPDALANQVTYSIDDTSVAKLVQVDGAWNVIALKPGSTVLTAKIGSKTDTITIKVADPEESKYKLIDAEVDDDLVALNVGTSQDVGVNVRFDNGVWTKLITVSTNPANINNVPNAEDDRTQGVYMPVWSSADESIATVSKIGRITGVKAGTTTVTATLGSYELTTVVNVVDPNAKPDDKPDVKPETPKFSDVAEGAWYADAVSAVVSEGWMDGTAEDHFAPEMNLSRAMAAQILWAKNGKEYVEYKGKFSDVATNDWYAQAVAWAADKGIVSGRSTTTFDPKGDISRQDFALMLAKEEAVTLPSDTKALDKYKDKADVASYAAPAVAWAVENKIISGVGENAEYVRPTWTMTRGQAAQMFSHLIKEDAPKA